MYLPEGLEDTPFRLLATRGRSESCWFSTAGQLQVLTKNIWGSHLRTCAPVYDFTVFRSNKSFDNNERFFYSNY